MTDVRLKRFAGTVYGAPGAQVLLLDCQDRLGLDVLCLLGACWLGATGRSLDVGGWRQVLAGHGRWREEVIEPLRRARRAIRPIAQAEAFYQQVKQCELSAEWLALEWIEPPLSAHAVRDPGLIEAATRRSIEAYCVAAGVDPEILQETREALIGLAVGWRAVTDAPAD